MFKFKTGDVVRFRDDWKQICRNNDWKYDWNDWNIRWRAGDKEKRTATVVEILNGEWQYKIKWDGISGAHNSVYEDMIELVRFTKAAEIYRSLDRIMKDAAKRNEV